MLCLIVNRPVRSRYYQYKRIVIGLATIGLFSHFMNELKQENDRRKSPSIFIPSIFYRAREESYRYWFLVRLAQKKKVHFSYYFYDNTTVDI